jgi:anti-sigma B factor antagonist
MFSVRLETRDCSGRLTIALCGELDLVDAAEVSSALAAASTRQPLVVVDLSGLTFIDASGVAALARGRQYARARGGELLLSAPKEQVRKMLAMTFPANAFFVPLARPAPQQRQQPRLGGAHG